MGAIKIDYELTTSARLAATFTTADRGKLIADLDTSDLWMVTRVSSEAIRVFV